jgi:hypothetical protein
MNVNQEKVFEALRDPRWDWRTLGGLERTTRLPGALILEILLANRSQVDFDVSPAHDNVLFRLKDRGYRSFSWMEQALNMMSFGGRGRLSSV